MNGFVLNFCLKLSSILISFQQLVTHSSTQITLNWGNQEIQQTYFSLAAYIIENDDTKILGIIYMLLIFPKTNSMCPVIHKDGNRDES